MTASKAGHSTTRKPGLDASIGGGLGRKVWDQGKRCRLKISVVRESARDGRMGKSAVSRAVRA